MPRQHQGTQALVVGGSIAGLLAARALADHYQRVIILERDTYPPAGEQRKGVPQGRHTHGLLASGRLVLERWFPGLSRDLIEAGAIPGDIIGDARWFNEGGFQTRFKSGLDGLLMSRPFLEGWIRRRVLDLPNVDAQQDFRAVGLTASSDGKRVTGVTGAGCEIAADLVIDATGRGSRSPEWLAALGYPQPEEQRVEIAMAYTTRHFRRRCDHADGDIAMFITPTPISKRGGAMLAQEGDRWIVTLAGYSGLVAPSELNGFIEYARTIAAPDIYEVIKDAEPAGEPESMRFPANVRRHYEKLDRFPGGYLVFGDAIASFNPIYGQGMSVAALESEALASVIAEGDRDTARSFFRQAAKIVDSAWAISVGNDMRIRDAGGRRNAVVNVLNWYMAKLHKAAHADPVPALAFFQVANLLAPPLSVLHPKVAWRVLARNYRRHSQAVRNAAGANSAPKRGFVPPPP